MKKILSIMLMLAMVFSMTSVFAYTDTDDVAVSILSELDIINGYEDGTFRPEGTVTRAELAKMIIHAMDKADVAEILKGETRFSDISTDAWYTGVVNVAVNNGFINGYPDGTFKPDQRVTFAEAATMIVKALGYTDLEGTWPTNYIDKAATLDLFDNVEGVTPNTYVNREAAANMILNALNDEKDIMVKYEYYDDATILGFEVDEGEVEATLEYTTDGRKPKTETVKGLIEDVDLLRLLPPSGEVSAIKIDGKFTVIENNNKIIEGYVGAEKKGKLEGYSFPGMDGEYVIAEVEGRKDVLTYTTIDDTEGYVLTKTMLNSMKRNNEDALVILNGIWTDVDSLKVGDYITSKTADLIYAARNTVKGEYEGYEHKAGDLFVTITVDGEDYEVLYSKFNSKDLKKDGEIELVFNHVGQLFSYEIEEEEFDANHLYFGIVDEEVTEGKDEDTIVIDGEEYVIAEGKSFTKLKEGDFVIYKLNRDGEISNVVSNRTFESGDKIAEAKSTYVKTESGDRIYYEDIENEDLWKDYQYAIVEFEAGESGEILTYGSVEEVEYDKDIFVYEEDVNAYIRDTINEKWKFVLIFVER